MSDFLSVNELAEYLRMNRATIYRLAVSGKIPGFKIGRHWRFRKDTIDSWIIEQEGHKGPLSRKTDHDGIELKCCLCNRPFSNSLKMAAECSMEGCHEPICVVCWNTKNRRYCSAHTLQERNSKHEHRSLAVSNQSGAIDPDIAKLKLIEYSFIGRFDAVIRQTNTIKDNEKIIAKIDSWDDIHESMNELSSLKKLSGNTISTRELIERYPLNTRSRYLIPLNRKMKIGDRSILVIEARVYVNHSILMNDAKNIRPIDIAEFSKIASDIEKTSKRSKSFLLVGILSPSGWTTDVINKIVGTSKQKSIKLKTCAICLFDQNPETIYYDKTDSRIASLIRLLKPDSVEEEVNGIIPIIEDRLVLDDFLVIKNLADDLKSSSEVIMAACRQLTLKNTDLEMVNLKRVGEVIRWKK